MDIIAEANNVSERMGRDVCRYQRNGKTVSAW